MASVVPKLAEHALEAAGLGGWAVDVATHRLEWTPQTFRIHEIDPGDITSLAGALEYYPPEARPLVEAAVAAAIADGTPWELETPLLTGRGRRIWVRSWGRAIRKAGRTVQLVGAFEDITERRALQESAARLAIVARQMTNAVIITDRSGQAEWVNEAFCRLTGFAPEDLRGEKPGEVLQGPQSDPATVRQMAEGISSGTGFEVEVVNYTRDRRPYWMAITCSPLRDEAGAITGFIAVETDVTERRQAEAALRRVAAERARTEALLRDVLDAIPSAVTAYDQDERFILANRAHSEMFPITARLTTPGRRYEEVLRLAVAHGQYPDAGSSEAEHEAWIAVQLAAHRNPGSPRTMHLQGDRFVLARERRSDSGNLVCVRSDTTDLMRAKEHLRVQAERDGMTGLANRAAFLATLEDALAAPTAAFGAGGAVLLLDIDYFKQINDTLGHDVGDALLAEVAARLRANLRGSDLPARLGGDEFGVVMPGLTEPQTLARRMEAIHLALSTPAELAGRHFPVSLSIGVTVFPADGSDAARLLKTADLALYEAKRSGRGRWAAFRPEQAEALDTQVRVADALRRALAHDELAVALQPKRRLRGGHAGFEALARWHDGTRWVPPAEFIPVAEETSQIAPLGRAVMQAALARIRELRDQGLDPGRVAVNVTGPQLLDSHFVAETLAALRRHDLRPADLELELTETVLLGRAAERIAAVLHAFADLGVTLALDDFGTGYASLAHLSRLPIDRLKIDRSFVSEIGQGGTGGVIARTVVSLAHSLGMEAIAEGIETAEQLAFLDTAGCDTGQGYLFSRPLLTLAEAADYLRKQDHAAATTTARLLRAAP